jgi:hypothetical protein
MQMFYLNSIRLRLMFEKHRSLLESRSSPILVASKWIKRRKMPILWLSRQRDLILIQPAFLLDIQLRYLYIQPNQRPVLIVIMMRHGFCGEVIVASFIAL